MISEISIFFYAKKLRVVVYPKKYSEEGKRKYYNLSEATRKRFQKVVLNHAHRIYFRKSGISFWLSR